MKSLNEIIKSVLKEYLTEQQAVDLNPKPIECLPFNNQQGYAYDNLEVELSYLLNKTDNFFKNEGWRRNYGHAITEIYNNTKILYDATVKDPYRKNNYCYSALHVVAFNYEYHTTKAVDMTGLLIQRLSNLINEVKTGAKYDQIRKELPDFFIPKLEEILQMFKDKIK